MGIIDQSETYKYFTGKTSIEVYGIHATYHYFVNSLSYQSSNLTLHGNYESTQVEEVNSLKKQYRMGEKVEVFYNPNNPMESVLIRDESIYSNNPWNEILIAGIVLVLMGLVVITTFLYKIIIGG